MLAGIPVAQAKVAKADCAGAPTITPGEGPLFFLFFDEKGWHLRFTGGQDAARQHKTAKHAFTGLLSTITGRISSVRPAMKGGDDTLNRVDKLRVFFKGVSDATTVEGIDFKLDDEATSLYLELFIDYDVLGPEHVRTGKDRKPVDEVSPSIQVLLRPAKE